MSAFPSNTSRVVFATTQWTVVLDAARAEAPASKSAFAQLYWDYWTPIYVRAG